MLDDISAVITGWAQDARDIAAGNTKRIVESQFPSDLVESMLHSASALRGHNSHELTRLGASQEDIRYSAEHQASNIVREVAMMARTARKKQRPHTWSVIARPLRTQPKRRSQEGNQRGKCTAYKRRSRDRLVKCHSSGAILLSQLQVHLWSAAFGIAAG